MMRGLIRGYRRVGRLAKGIATNWRLSAGGLVSSILICSSVSAGEEIAASDKVKAAYLLHFSSYVSWPERELSSVNLCLVGDDPFGGYIDAMVTAKPLNRHGQKIVIHRLKHSSSAKHCQILYVHLEDSIGQSTSVSPHQRETLYVGDAENFLASRGMIRFFIRDNRVRLEVHLSRVRAAGMSISSELLKISDIVKGDE